MHHMVFGSSAELAYRIPLMFFWHMGKFQRLCLKMVLLKIGNTSWCRAWIFLKIFLEPMSLYCIAFYTLKTRP